jgi:hypothetical protein
MQACAPPEDALNVDLEGRDRAQRNGITALGDHALALARLFARDFYGYSPGENECEQARDIAANWLEHAARRLRSAG